MSQQYEDISILQSIRSQDSEPQQQKNNKKIVNPKNNVQVNKNKLNIDLQDNLDFGYSTYEPKQQKREAPPKNDKKQKGKMQSEQSDTDWNETDQIVCSLKNKSQNGKNANVRKKQEKQKNVQIKYPQIVPKYDKNWNNKAAIQTKVSYIESQINQNQYLDTRVSTQQEQMMNINMSMIGERSKKPTKENKTINVNRQQNSKAVAQLQKNDINPFKSIYLTNNNKKQQAKDVICLKIMDNTMYWVFDKKQIKVTSQTLQILVQQFFKKQIMLPIISDTQYKSNHIAKFLLIYTEFVNNFYPEQFRSAFSIIKGRMQNGSKSQSSFSPATPKSSQNSTIKNIYNYAANFLKRSGYSKPQLIRNHMIKKLQMLMLWKIQIQNMKNKQIMMQKFERQQQNLQHYISILQLLVSFQFSQQYCKKNSKEGIDHQIWKQHIKKINQLKRKWIAKIENQQIAFAFKV